MDRRLTLQLVGLCAVALVLRLLVFSRSLSALDRLLIPDDTYYTLAIARSLAHGLGPAADGSTATSGFQPLLAFVMAPFYALGAGNDAALRIDLFLLILADTATVWMVGVVGFRMGGRTAAVVAATVWAVSPVAIAISLGGLEASLAVLCASALLVASMWAGDRPVSQRRRIVVGVLAGLAVLARVDLVVLVGLLFLAEIIWGSRRGLVTSVVTAAVVLAPWWLWCTYEFGSPVPSSGAAAHRVADVGSFSMAAQSTVAGTVATAPFGHSAWLRQLLYDHVAFGTVCFWGIVVLLVGAAIAALAHLRRLEPTGTDVTAPRTVPRAAYVTVVCVFAAVLMAFYSWFAVLWFLSRYLQPVALAATILLAVLIARYTHDARSQRFVAIVFALAVGAALVGDVHLMTARTEPIRAFETGTGYRDAARGALALVPDGDRIGAYQSGALAYYADRRVTVVNLDGVVNPDAPDPRDYPATARYLERRGVRWLADRPLPLTALIFKGSAVTSPPRTFVKVAGFPQGSGTQLELLRIDPAPPRRL